MTRTEVLKNIEQCEKDGEFDKHVDPVDYSLVKPFDENFPYVPKGFTKLSYALKKFFVIKPFTNKINKKDFKTVFSGLENIKGINSAIVTCNHVNIFDCLIAKKALEKHSVYILVAEFNNRNDWLGGMMRAGGILPMKNEMKVIKKLNESIELLLKNNNYVMFYPEQAMWWNYEKPRPYKNGAFHYAAKHNVPVIPLFITFKDTAEVDEEGIFIKQFFCHILKPVYPKEGLTRAQNIDYLKDANAMQTKQKYEEFYGRELIYTTVYKDKD